MRRTRRVTCTRPSTLAKALSDGAGLAPFFAATTLQMLGQHPDLRNRLPLVDPSSWRAYKPLHEEAQRRRGKPEAEAGTNIHLGVAHLLSGAAPDGIDPSTLRDARTVLDALEAHGLEPVESEMFVACLDGLPEPVGGSLDLLCRDTSRGGGIVVVDIKTSGSAGSERWRSLEWAIQMSCYAHGSRYGAEPERDSYQRPLVDPALLDGGGPVGDLQEGYVVDLVRESDLVAIHRIDLLVGWSAARLACDVRAMRRASAVMASVEYTVDE